MDKKTLFLLLSKINSGSGDYYTKAEIDNMISQLKQFETEYLDSGVLPAQGEPNVLYFLPKTSPSGHDYCYEYMWINDKWEFVGSTDVDMSDYWTIDEVKQYVDDNAYVLPEATVDTLGGVKVSQSGSVQLDENGNMIISTVTEEDIAKLFNH